MKKTNIILSITAILIILGIFIFLNNSSSTSGELEISFTNEEKEISKIVKYEEGDNLTELITENFNNVTFDSGLLITIEDYVTPENYSTYISLAVDDEYSSVGINQVDIENSKVIDLIVVENTYNEG